jgi:hypothetical protein
VGKGKYEKRFFVHRHEGGEDEEQGEEMRVMLTKINAQGQLEDSY